MFCNFLYKNIINYYNSNYLFIKAQYPISKNPLSIKIRHEHGNIICITNLSTKFPIFHYSQFYRVTKFAIIIFHHKCWLDHQTELTDVFMTKKLGIETILNSRKSTTVPPLLSFLHAAALVAHQGHLSPSHITQVPPEASI